MQRSAWKNNANWRTKQLKNYTKSQLHVLTAINLEKKKMDRLENCQRFGHWLFWHAYIWVALVDLILSGPWAITKWTRACDKRSAHLWIQTLLSFWKYSTTMQIGTVSGLWIFRKCRRLKIIIRETVVHLQRSYVLANKLDVQDTDIRFTQFNRSWNYFSWCRFTHGWNTRSWSLGFGYWSVSLFSKPTKEKQWSRTRRLVG